MFLTTREKRRITIAAVIVLLIIIGVAAYYFLPQTGEKVTNTEKKETTATQKEAPPAGITSYTQYSKKENTCVYYYKDGQCYVPLSFCVTDPGVKTPQDIDKEKYCSTTPEIKAEALKSPVGSACPFTATEGDLIDLYSIVRDPDETDPTHPFGPLGRLEVSFSDPFKGSKGLWKTKPGDAGVYNFEISVTDGQYTDTKPYCIEVKIGNRPPVLSNVNDMQLMVGDTVTIEPKCTDPDGDQVTISYVGDLSNREWFTGVPKKTGQKDIGIHVVTIRCTDSRGLPAYKSIKVAVGPAPILPPPSLRFVREPTGMTLKEGETVTLSPSVESDAGKPVTITYSGWMSSSTKTASYTDAGVHPVTITATDGIITISTTISITVINVNRPPEIVGTEQSS